MLDEHPQDPEGQRGLEDVQTWGETSVQPVAVVQAAHGRLQVGLHSLFGACSRFLPLQEVVGAAEAARDRRRTRTGKRHIARLHSR